MTRPPAAIGRTLAASILALAAACAEEPRDPATTGEPAPSGGAAGAESLALEADVAVMESFPVQLRGTLRVSNPTGDPVSFDVGGCPVFLRVYGADGAPIWDQGDGAICTMILRTVRLEPGGSESFETGTASAADILGEDGTDGTYRVAVYLALVSGGQPEADAGEVPLAVPR
ncbi:MAG TPA: hypothetical protein VFS53_02670 [Gemmatimonadota bacterium]|nr:hypothetical protein [Gemmatimonadota bacterium]